MAIVSLLKQVVVTICDRLVFFLYRTNARLNILKLNYSSSSHSIKSLFYCDHILYKLNVCGGFIYEKIELCELLCIVFLASILWFVE